MFLLSLVFISLAHCVRIFRWELFISTYESPSRRTLYRSLSIGYLFNAFLPLKLGDLVRMWISGNKMENGKGFSMAIIVVERCLDILVVGIVFSIFYIFRINIANNSLMFYIIISAILVVLIVLVFIFRGFFKKALKLFASLFNDNIEFRLLKFSWALIWSFKDIITRISKIKLIAYTSVMWLLYILSYFFFAEFLSNSGLQITWHDIFYILFAENSLYIGNFEALSGFTGSINTVLCFALYIIVPSLILFALSFFVKKKKNNINSYLKLIPHLDKSERLSFLEMYFSNENKEYVESYLKINQHISIIRDFSAGSNATTMLCRDDDNHIFYRKYAFGSDGEKLYEQIKWINDYSNILTLTKIINYKKEDNYCFYDMPFISGTNTMFNYSHTYQIDKSWMIIEAVLNELKNTIYSINTCKSDRSTIEKYIISKVEKNMDFICHSDGIIGQFIKYDSIIINGIRFKNLNYYRKYLNKDHLINVFSEDCYSVIHGDLTIENIVAINNDKNKIGKDYYIIDPNTGNIHNSPFLDYGKLLQSLHGCYEFLMEQDEITVNENCICFPLKKSEVYAQLLKKYNEYLFANYSEHEVKSIYYHEIIHWLRLMPYKIKKIGDRAALFYAGMLMVMNDVEKRFEN